MHQVGKNKIDQLDTLVHELLGSSNYLHGLGRALRNLRKELNLYKNHTRAMLEKKKLLYKEYPKVQLGGGKHMLPGFLNIDIAPPADLIYDLREGIPLLDKSTRFIFTEHFLEHIDYPMSVKKLIRECYRVLQPGGEIVIGVPDGKLAMKAYVRQDKEFFDRMLATWYKDRNCLGDLNTYIDLINYVFRDQDDDEEFNPHLWTFDFEKLDSLLRAVGFKDVRPWKLDKKIANSRREWGSVYVKAVK